MERRVERRGGGGGGSLGVSLRAVGDADVGVLRRDGHLLDSLALATLGSRLCLRGLGRGVRLGRLGLGGFGRLLAILVLALLAAAVVDGGVGGGERVETASERLVNLALEGGVPVVLDGVIGAPDEGLGDLGPLVAVLRVGDDELAVLLAAPLLALDVGVEVVVPALAALLADATGELLRDLGPLLRAESAHELDDLGVFLLSPGTLHELGIEHFLPAVKALHVGALIEVLSCEGENSK